MNEPITIYPKVTGLLMASGYNKLGTQEAMSDMFVVERNDMQKVLSIEANQSDARYKIQEDGTVQTLLGRMGTGGNNVPMALAYDGTEVSPTLTASNAGGEQRMPDKGNFNAVIGQEYIVRRLTPTEAERLQGFPDRPYGWTDIGEWMDTKGKKHQTTDSARYKALGNSIAVGFANEQRGFWMWLIKRISAQFERSATMGSLFDGISGFPLAWATYNGPKNCLWSSEIEEFCIAVCKRHFGDEETGEEGDIYEYLKEYMG